MTTPEGCKAKIAYDQERGAVVTTCEGPCSLVYSSVKVAADDGQIPPTSPIIFRTARRELELFCPYANGEPPLNQEE